MLPQKPISLNKLLKAHQVFTEKVKKNQDHYNALSKGQSPEILLITCCDSRVDPHALFNVQAGDIFVIRNVANLIPSFTGQDDHLSTKAAIEYAVKFLKVKHIVILGHSGCGGIQAMHDSQFHQHQTDFIEQWVKPQAETVNAALRTHNCNTDNVTEQREKKSIAASFAHLHSYPWIAPLLQSGQLKAHGWHYDIASGNIDAYDEKNQCFAPLKQLMP